jgi:hypothetical protein
LFSTRAPGSFGATAARSTNGSVHSIRTKDSEWLHGDTYLSAYDLKGNVLLNAAFPQREGTNIVGQKDAKGKPFQDEILQIAATEGIICMSAIGPKRTRRSASAAAAFGGKADISLVARGSVMVCGTDKISSLSYTVPALPPCPNLAILLALNERAHYALFAVALYRRP